MGTADKEFLNFYIQFKDKIYNYFWYRVGFDAAQAEDMTSEVFLKAYSNFESFDRERRFQPWIYKIARNHLINFYRIQGRDVELTEAASSIETAGEINAKLELDTVMRCIQELEPYHRDVLLMRFVDGFENREIADLLGKEEGAVRTQLSRAMSALKKSIQQNYGQFGKTIE